MPPCSQGHRRPLLQGIDTSDLEHCLPGLGDYQGIRHHNAIVDRLVHHSIILNIEGPVEDARIKETQQPGTENKIEKTVLKETDEIGKPDRSLRSRILWISNERLNELLWARTKRTSWIGHG